jgi:hypothetical protein
MGILEEKPQDLKGELFKGFAVGGNTETFVVVLSKSSCQISPLRC